MADHNRNLNPHAEARLAMAIWGEEYAYKQTGGSMDFWDSRTDQQKALCVSIIDDVMKAMANKGRAYDDSRSSKVDRFELGRDSRNRPVMNKNDHGDWVPYQDYETACGFEAMWKAHRDELLSQIEQLPYKAATDRISEYLNRVPGAYQADDGRRYWTREQVLEAVKECSTPAPQPQMVVTWLPIERADRSISSVHNFEEAGLVLRNSDPYWVRDDDGRVYEAVWTESDNLSFSQGGHWWDLEGESPVDPVEFMPHPLDPRFHPNAKLEDQQ